MRLTCEKLGKRYGHQLVIKEINLSIASKEIVGITGSNGSGKSTLLKMLSGFLSPSTGKVEYELGSEVIDRSNIYKCITYSAPYIDLPLKLTPLELYNHYIKYKRLRVDSFESFINNCDLKSASNKQIGNFSSGMKQRLSVAFSLASLVELTILDEPTSFMDEDAKDWYQSELKKSVGLSTIIIASNDQFDVKQATTVYKIHEKSIA